MLSAYTQPAYQLPSEGELLRELCNRSFHRFLREFWSTICHDQFRDNWHIPYLCNECQIVAKRVAEHEPNPHDLIINIPPGTSKSSIFSVFFPVWCWTWHPWMRFLTFSYNQQVANKSADLSKKIIESMLFQQVYPDIRLRKSKEGVTDYEISVLGPYGWAPTGGGRFSSSVGGTGTAFHGDILIPDDAINAEQSFSQTNRYTANRWVSQTLPSRKTDKIVSSTMHVGQRLHEDDPSGHLLANKELSLKHICLPADISDQCYADLVNPPELKQFYVDGLLDPVRLNRKAIDALTAQLGQYGAAAQLGQNPSPPEGGMFKVDRMPIIDRLPPEVSMVKRVRAWDKAGTAESEKGSGEPAWTVGHKMSLWVNGSFIVEDEVRGRWSAKEREDIILATARADGKEMEIWIEQEPGSGGKESAEATVRNLAGFNIRVEKPVTNKIARADPFSAQVERHNIMLLRGDWNRDYKEELRLFPSGKFKDRVDASSMAFTKLVVRKQVRLLSRSR